MDHGAAAATLEAALHLEEAVQEPQSVTAPEYIDEVIEEVVNNDIGINDEELIAELEEVIEEEIEEEIEYIGESVYVD